MDSSAATGSTAKLQHHSTLAKFRQALSHHSILQQSPQLASSTIEQVLQKQKEAFQSLVPSSTSSKLLPAESALQHNDPFHSDSLRVPLNVAFQTSMTKHREAEADPNAAGADTSFPTSDMSVVTSMPLPYRTAPVGSVPTAAPATAPASELRNVQQRLDRLVSMVENMHATTIQLFYDFLVYLILGLLVVFTLDQYVAHRNIAYSSLQRIAGGSGGGGGMGGVSGGPIGYTR